MEEVVVTGSRIRRQDFEANSPIVTVDSSTFEETSTIGLDTILNQLPQFIPGMTGSPSGTPNQGANEAQQFGTGGSQFASGGIEASAFATPGTSSVNLRGLGAGRNLVLIDGRRGMPVNASMTVDLNSIPSSAVERIEVVSGGASAVYGADAIAGAVNFILKDDFEGLDISTNYSMTELGDAEEYRISGLFGANTADGRGNVMIGLNYASRARGDFNKRDWFDEMRRDPAQRGNALFPTNTFFGVFDSQFSGFVPSTDMRAALNTVFPESGNDVSPFLGFLSVNRSDGSVYAGTGFFGSVFDRDGAEKYNGEFDVNGFPKRKIDPLGGIVENQEENWVSVPLERYSMFAKSTYAISDNISAFANINYARTITQTSNQFSPATTSWGADIPHGPNLWAGSVAESDLVYAPNGDVSAAPGAATLPAFLQGGSYGLNCPAVGGCTRSEAFPKPPEVALLFDAAVNPNTVRVSRVLDYMGERSTLNTTNNYQFIFGLEGEMDNGYYWDVSLSHGESEAVTQLTNFASLDRYRDIIQSPNYGTNFARTGNPSANGWGAGTGNCTSGLPLFEDFQASDDCLNSIRAVLSNIGVMKQDTFDANLGGTILEMPAGPLQFAAGVAFRKNDYSYISSDNNLPSNFKAQAIGLYPNDRTVGSIGVKEYYGELLVPLVSNGPVGMRNVNLELGGRISDYYDTSGEVSTAKALVDWTVLDWMRFRGGYQKATRAPNINELFTGRARQVWNLADNEGDVCSMNNYESTLGVAQGPKPEDGTPSLSSPAQAAQTMAICQQLMGNSATAYYSIPVDDQPDPGGAGQAWITGNPNVQPETADTWTAGLVMTSPFVDNAWLAGAQVSIDWYQIEMTDMISQISADVITLRCFSTELNPTGDINNEYCQRFQRDPSTGSSQAVDTTFTNETEAKLSGVDINLNWTAQFADLGFDSIPGGLGINMVATVPLKMQTQQTADSPLIDWVGYQAGGSCPQGISCTSYDYTMFTTFNYFNGPYNLSLRWQFIPDIEPGAKATNPASTSFGVHDAYNMFALTGSYRLNEKVTLMGGIENLFDSKPPKAGGNPTNSDYPIPPVYSGGGRYDVLGRRYYVSANLSF